MYWMGSETEIAGKRPRDWVPFDDNFDDEKRIQQGRELAGPAATDRPDMITMYHSDVDKAGHAYGPDSPETGTAVKHVDAMTRELQEKIRATGLHVDLIVVSDMG